MNQRIGICFHGTRILPISIAHEGFFDEPTMQLCALVGSIPHRHLVFYDPRGTFYWMFGIV